MTPDGLISLLTPVTWVVVWNNRRYGGLSLLQARAFARDRPGAWVLPVATFLMTKEVAADGSSLAPWPKGQESGWQETPTAEATAKA